MSKTNRAARLEQISSALRAIDDINVTFTFVSLQVSGDRSCVNHALNVLGLEKVNPDSNLDDAHWDVANKSGQVIGTYYASDESATFMVRTVRKAA